MENHTLDLKDRASFRFWTPVTIRFSDQDPLGHVNNVAYAAYIEAARTMFLGGLLNPDDNPGIDYVLARVVIDYVKETHYPGTVDVGGRVTTVGTKSITSGYGVFVGDQCVATSESVNVFFSLQERKTIAIPDNVRADLESDPMREHNQRGYRRGY
jgi:acyl-CoA thioester hydrolase